MSNQNIDQQCRHSRGYRLNDTELAARVKTAAADHHQPAQPGEILKLTFIKYTVAVVQ